MTKTRQALLYARRTLVAERRTQFDCFTLPPNRDYAQMTAPERHAIAS